jgi:hypothetical protein
MHATPLACSAPAHCNHKPILRRPQNQQVEAPIFGDLPRLPAPLGTFFHTASLFRRLPLADRLTALGLVGPLLEHDVDEATYAE